MLLQSAMNVLSVLSVWRDAQPIYSLRFYLVVVVVMTRVRIGTADVIHNANPNTRGQTSTIPGTLSLL